MRPGQRWSSSDGSGASVRLCRFTPNGKGEVIAGPFGYANGLALSADEHGLIAGANMHLPGRQIDPELIRRDLRRLARWERERAARQGESVPAA